MTWILSILIQIILNHALRKNIGFTTLSDKNRIWHFTITFQRRPFDQNVKCYVYIVSGSKRSYIFVRATGNVMV